MKISRCSLAIGTLVSFLCGAAGASAQESEQKIQCKDVPAAARAAFEKAYPKATIKGCAKELEQGKMAYEIMSTEGRTGRDVLFYADGKLIVVEETIAQGNLPEPVRLLREAEKIGPSTIALIEAVMQAKPHPEQGFRACLGILRLANDYGGCRLEAACRRGLDNGARTYGSIASILKLGLDRAYWEDPAQAEPPIRHANIRGQSYFQ